MSTVVNISLSSQSTLKHYSRQFNDAVNLLNIIIRKSSFRELVNSFKYDWKHVDFRIEDTSVYEHLFVRKKMHEMQVHVRNSLGKFGRKSTEILGTTVVGSPVTVVNEHWISKLPLNCFHTVMALSAHLAHEYCHQLGFYDGKHTKQINVVPYYIGDLVYDFANDLFAPQM